MNQLHLPGQRAKLDWPFLVSIVFQLRDPGSNPKTLLLIRANVSYTDPVNTFFFKDWIDRFLVPVDEPGSRLFHLNILTSLGLIAVWLLLVQLKSPPIKPGGRVRFYFQQLQNSIFRKKYWWNRSTKIDYHIYFLNSFLKVFLFIPYLDFSFRISKTTISWLLKSNHHQMLSLKASYPSLLAFSILAFVFDDFLRFFHHYLMHKIPFLWKLHKTHHSAKILTPMSLYRIHPLESAMSTVRNSLSTGMSIGVFIFLFNSQFSIITIFGINLFGFLFNLLGSNLRHSHIPLSFGPLEWIFISPKQHQIHHSSDPKHYDKNFGVSLAMWDGLIGTLIRSKNVSSKLRFGLKGHRQTLKNTLFSQ
jgi:sterol desaturase/sphingolipid hydroxylase (fatty acid hydroxylase superfamily)